MIADQVQKGLVVYKVAGAGDSMSITPRICLPYKGEARGIVSQ
jgi:hypothetical protein